MNLLLYWVTYVKVEYISRPFMYNFTVAFLNIIYIFLFQASRISATHIVFKNSVEEIAGMDDVRGIARDAGFQSGTEAAFAYSEIYLNYESNKVGFDVLSEIESHLQQIAEREFKVFVCYKTWALFYEKM